MKTRIRPCTLLILLLLLQASFCIESGAGADRKAAPPEQHTDMNQVFLPPHLPRLVILPLQPSRGQDCEGTGLAVQFLLSNVTVLNTGLEEFWFSWRMKKIFPSGRSLLEYIRGEDMLEDVRLSGNKEGIRYWIFGNIEKGIPLKVRLNLIDCETAAGQKTCCIDLDPAEGLDSFCRKFIEWLSSCGLPMKSKQVERALWDEKTSLRGLSLLGKALEKYYLLSYEKKGASLKTESFQKAIEEAPCSYLAMSMMGWAMYKNADYLQAKRNFTSALKLNNSGAGALSGLIWCAVKSGDEDRAYELGDRRAGLREEPAGLWKAIIANRFGNICRKNGEKEKAVLFYETAASFNPCKALYFTKQASLHAEMGRKEKAIGLLEEALKKSMPEEEKQKILKKREEIL